MKKFYFSLLLILLIGQGASAQNGITIDSCSIANLNCNFYTSFVVDNSGNKWMGFRNTGVAPHPSPQLLRFNGTTWDSFPHVPGKKINAIAVDAANHLWIGTDTGLVMFDGSTFTTYCMANSSIASNKVLSVACGGGKVYAGTYAGLCVYNGSSFTNYNHANNNLSHDSIYAIAYESSSAVWLGNVQGVEKFYGSGFSFYFDLGGIGSDKVNTIYIDQQNNKWIGTSNRGVVKFDNSNFHAMQELYGNRPTMPGYIPFLYWPKYCNSITKGENGGVCFMGAANTGFYGYGLIEVTANQVYCYNVPTSWQNNINTSLLAYDTVSDFLFVGNRSGTWLPPATIFKFDHSQYHDLTYSDLTFLNINEVQAGMLGDADFAWDLSNSQYTVPKEQNSQALFAASLWMGGYNNGQLHLAAMTYRQNGVDFWPGPLDTLSDSTIYTWGNLNNPLTPNRPLWKINRYDVANFIYNWNAGNVQNGTFTPPQNFLTWPGNGTGNYAHNLAPYVDVNGNNIYDPIQGGDYPLIKGDQMLWWVFNDKAGNHGETGAAPFGVEVHASAYAFVCPNVADSNRAINYTTFYNYKIFNRSSMQYDSSVIGLWMDADLGNYQDDYIGCNVMNNYGFIYNGDNYDEDGGGHTGYHANLPAFACNILRGPLADPSDGIDNDNDGVIDESNEQCLMTSFDYYTNTGDIQTGNPNVNAPQQYFNFINSTWRNGTPMTFGGNGTHAVDSLHPPCRFMFPGTTDPYGIGLGGSASNPVALPDTNWTQYTAGVVKNDMRFLMGAGPFTMQPHGVYEFDYALVFSQDSANCYGDNICVLNRAKEDNNRVRNWFNNNSFPSCLSMAGVGIKENTVEEDFRLYPNPTHNYIYLEFKESFLNTTIEVTDMLGKIVRAGTYGASQKYIAIPIEDLSPGVYSVRFKVGNSFGVKKFVKD